MLDDGSQLPTMGSASMSSIAANRVKMTKWRDHERARRAATRFAAIEMGAETADAA